MLVCLCAFCALLAYRSLPGFFFRLPCLVAFLFSSCLLFLCVCLFVAFYCLVKRVYSWDRSRRIDRRYRITPTSPHSIARQRLPDVQSSCFVSTCSPRTMAGIKYTTMVHLSGRRCIFSGRRCIFSGRRCPPIPPLSRIFLRPFV